MASRREFITPDKPVATKKKKVAKNKVAKKKVAKRIKRQDMVTPNNIRVGANVEYRGPDIDGRDYEIYNGDVHVVVQITDVFIDVIDVHGRPCPPLPMEDFYTNPTKEAVFTSGEYEEQIEENRSKYDKLKVKASPEKPKFKIDMNLIMSSFMAFTILSMFTYGAYKLFMTYNLTSDSHIFLWCISFIFPGCVFGVGVAAATLPLSDRVVRYVNSLVDKLIVDPWFAFWRYLTQHEWTLYFMGSMAVWAFFYYVVL